MKMVTFFEGKGGIVYAVRHGKPIEAESDQSALEWLFSGAKRVSGAELSGYYVGPRAEMITPWSTTAVEITENRY